MSRLLDDPKLGLLVYSTGRPVMRGDVCLWFHLAPLRFEIGPRGSGDVVTIPAFDPSAWSDADLARFAVEGRRGITDLASIPALARSLLPANGQYAGASLPHDDGYESKGWGRLSRAEVDRLLLELMIDAGVPAWRRTIVYQAVRLGGGSGWGR